MSALVWQALIAGSIVSAFVLGRALLPLRRAIQLGTATAGFSMFWTLGLSSWFVGYAISGGLQNFQFALIVAVTLMALGAVLIYAHNAQQREVLESGVDEEPAERMSTPEAIACRGTLNPRPCCFS